MEDHDEDVRRFAGPTNHNTLGSNLYHHNSRTTEFLRLPKWANHVGIFLLLLYALTLTYLDLTSSSLRRPSGWDKNIKQKGTAVALPTKEDTVGVPVVKEGDTNDPSTDLDGTAATTPTLCTRYLSSLTPHQTTTTTTAESNPIFFLTDMELELRPILLPHCQRRHYLRLEDYLPDLPFFRSLALAMHPVTHPTSTLNTNTTTTGFQSSSSSSTPMIRALLAGRGTTGTRTLENDWARHMGFATLHWRFVHNCQSDDRREKKDVSDCLATTVNRAIDATRTAVPHQLFHRPNVSENEYKSVLLDPFAQALATMFGSSTSACGHCRQPLVVGDNPYTYFFTELYLAAGPDMRVVLSRREAADWARRRQEAHGREWVCQPPWRSRQDPFSPTQCTSRQLTSVSAVDVDILRAAMEHYEAYIHALVPGNSLLDLNLFTSALLDNATLGDRTQGGAAPTSMRDQWTNDLQATFRDFLGAP